jgi:hypothetical protein
MNCNKHHIICKAVGDGWICTACETRYMPMSGYIGGLTVDEVMDIYHEWDKQAVDGIIPMIPDFRARLTAKTQGQ